MNANVLVTKCHGPEWKIADGSKSNQNAGIPNAAGVILRHISWARRMAPSSIREHTKTTMVTSTKTMVIGIRLANFNSRTIAKDVSSRWQVIRNDVRVVYLQGFMDGQS